MNNNIPIVFSTDNNYVMQTGVAILSLIESARPETIYDIYVLVNDDVTEESKQLLRKQVGCFLKHTIEFKHIGNVFEKSFEIRNISVAAYSRLLIPWILPQYDKILYSDVDVIFHTDLGDIYNVDLNENLVAGIPAPAFFINQQYRKYLKQLKQTPGEYINSGFLLINSKLQREMNLKSGFIAEASKQYTFQDQDIINIVCNGRIAHLSPAYCVTPAFYDMLISENLEFRAFYENANFLPAGQDMTHAIDNYKRGEHCIIHYAGNKPWNTFTQAWTDWWTIYRRSIFYEPDREINLSRQILCPIPLWCDILRQIKRKLRM